MDDVNETSDASAQMCVAYWFGRRLAALVLCRHALRVDRVRASVAGGDVSTTATPERAMSLSC